MKIQKTRREKLYKSGKPHIREYVRDDIRWLWAAAKRAGNQMAPEEFEMFVDAVLKQSERRWILEDVCSEFATGFGPVGLVLATYDGWSLGPHVEWFPWASTRNKLRSTVGFLQAMRYAREIGSIKISTTGSTNRRWFKYLKRYLPIAYAGSIPGGRVGGEDEYIFYLRGRKHGMGSSSRRGRQSVEQPDGRQGREEQESGVEQELASGHPPPAGSIPEPDNVGRELRQN